MLSTENPPPDLSEEIPQLKSSASDERTSGNNHRQFEVDLCKSGLDDNNNPLPKFSIRDYVFSTRGKDIGNNWPFSQKNLQLCLKHGVKDVLPPFQSLGSVGSLTIVECAVDKLRDSDVQHPELIAQKINSSESEEDKEFPSTTTSQSCSDINSVPPILEPRAVELPVSFTEKQVFPVRGPKKAESNARSPLKKCRLIVKLNNITEPKSNEDLVVVSETMTSKVCPVCKTFTSSSNTTLNAHIDQCLAGESSIKWTANPKVIKHRIKARKTKLMVDIYETALPCTLEDLDKRNGTNWASNLGPPSQDLEASGGEEEKKTYSSVNREDINQEGAVYIDSSGTKLRILSKLSDLPSKPNVEDDAEPGFVKTDKGRKLLSSKKKKYFVNKGKLQGHSFDGQGSCSPISDHLLERPHRSSSCYHRLEVDNGQEMLFDSEVSKEDDPSQRVVTSGEMKLDDFGMIKKWVGSKRTGLKKKINLELENQHPDKSIKNLRIKSVASLGDTLSKGNIASTSPASSDEYHPFPTQSHKRKDNLLCNSQDRCLGPTCQGKRPAFSLLKPQHRSDKKNHLMFSKFNVKQSRIDSTSTQEHHMDPPNGTENHVSSRYSKKMGIGSSTNEKDDRSFIGSNMSEHHRKSTEGNKFASVRKTSLGHAMSSGSKKLTSLRTKLLSVRHSSVTESKKNKGRKLLNSENTRPHCTSGSDEDEAAVSRSAVHMQDIVIETRRRNEVQLEKESGNLLIKRTRVLKIRKKMRVENSGGDMSSKSLETSPESDGHSVGKNVDSFSGGNGPNDSSDDLEEEAEMQEEFVSEPTYGGEAFVSFNKSLDSAFPGLTDSSTVECGSHFYGAPTRLVLNADQDHVVAEMDANEGQGNYFVDVDPIPIPGPPGSFLPSPGRMGSEELQGHSSLTTCRIQSSEEGHEVVDMDSSDSPISAISAVSNSVAARSNSISITNRSEQLHFQHETRCNISEERSGPVIERCSTFEQVASGDRELNLLESRPNLMLHQATRESQNIQQCCCSRKDGSFQGGSLEYQDSQILRRRTMTSPVLPQEKHMSDDRKNEIYSLNFGSGTFSKNEPTPEPENHVVNSPMGYAPLLISRNSETMFPAGGDCESPSPSTPNPVLRLMGKNLMVVSKDENPSPQTRPTQPGMIIDHPAPRQCAENTLPSNQNEPNSYHHNRGPSSFNNLQPSISAHHFDFNSNSSNGFKVPANCGPPGFPAYPSTAMFSGTSFGGTVSSRCHGYANGFNLIADQLGSKIRLDPHTIYDTGKASTPTHHPADSSGCKHKEIIIIDDSPESEAGLAVNPFGTYQTRVYPRFTGSPTGPTGNTQIPSTKAMTAANLGKWNCVPEGSSAFLSNSSSASLPSTARLRSSVYFPPGFS